MTVSRRMACWLYEGMLLFAVVFVAGWLFSTLGQMRNAMDERRHLLQAFLFVVFGIYFTWFWARGQTLAMKTWHIRVVDTVGPCHHPDARPGRYALSWLWFLPPLAALPPSGLSAGESVVICAGLGRRLGLLSRFHPQRQFWHDALAGTRCVVTRHVARSRTGAHRQSTHARHRFAPVNPQKARTGLNRVWHATGYSLEGLRAGWGETAFRQEAMAAMVLLPLAFWLGRSWVERGAAGRLGADGDDRRAAQHRHRNRHRPHWPRVA
jgi:uncharacterized RDD family membrane protein YckC